MKEFFSYIIILILLLLVGCLTDDDKKIRAYNIGDKFTYQESKHVSIARADDNVIVYRLYTSWNSPHYYYFSTTRSDSIIYNIHSKVKFR